MAGRNARNVRGGNAALNSFKRNLKRLPTTLAIDVASRAGPAMTDLTQDAHQGRRGVYGEPYPLGADGRQLSLYRTGDVARSLLFESVGTTVRVVLGEPYAKYLIRYGLLPNGVIPEVWRRKLNEIVHAAKVAL